jgi:hypothetical protein
MIFNIMIGDTLYPKRIKMEELDFLKIGIFHIIYN